MAAIKLQHPWGLQPVVENIPAEIREGAWCCWRAKPRENKIGKIDKVPYYPSVGNRRGLSTERSGEWGTFEEAIAAFEADSFFDGIGRLVPESGGEVWFDLDGCVEDGRVTNSELAALLEELNTYAEVSPSGKGLRVFGYGELPGQDIGNHDAGIEIYGGSGARFLTVTGRMFGNDPKQVRTFETGFLSDVHRRYKPILKPRSEDTPAPEFMDPEQLPILEHVGLPPQNVLWLLHGFDPRRNRSLDLQSTTKFLYGCGLDDASVYTLLHECSGSWEVALDHREQKPAKASAYLWKHCLDARHVADEIRFDPLEFAEKEGTESNNDRKPKDLVALFVNRYVYVEQGDRVCDLKRPAHAGTIKLGEFKNSTANVRQEVPDPIRADPDRTKMSPVHAVWLVHPSRKTAFGEIYDPTHAERLFRDEFGLWRINSFHLPMHKKTGASIQVFLDHMDYLLPVLTERTWFLDWLAFIVQRPQQRCKVTPLHVSTFHGTGRGWVVELIQILLGHWNCSKTKMDALCGEGNSGQYQEYLHNSLVCFVEEAKEGGRRWAVSDKIRDRLTENTLPINRKFVGEATENVFTNFFMATNHRDALVLTNEDRRIQVLSGPDWLQDTEYYDRLYGWLSGDGPSQLYHWLTARDLSKFDWRRSSETPARRWMVESNRSPTEELFWAVMDNPPAPGLTIELFLKAMIGAGDGDAFDINDRELVKLLREHAADKRQLKLSPGRKVNVWVLDRTLRDNNRENNSVLRDGVIDYED